MGHGKKSYSNGLKSLKPKKSLLVSGKWWVADQIFVLAPGSGHRSRSQSKSPRAEREPDLSLSLTPVSE